MASDVLGPRWQELDFGEYQVETGCADKKNMSTWVMAFLSVSLFCVCTHFLARAILTPVPALNSTTYNRVALRIKRRYQIFAWAVMTTTFMLGLVISFWQVFVEL
ncbi:MAG: hypothetical protein COT73_05485 [Bdellovibrio sp. CG10_big_fil_rev_8_21_14_0_10_47_8]|nr:MAG: hypothetical protein COT73_05485 [Bdellovibrio sp. CG10_big_fil_rev_8_21_14_0_10_47_8]